ncbi:MAG: protein kinase [Planctomycetaceae bacterium]
MNSSDRNPIDRVAEEFAQRIRGGENPTVDEYVQRYPQHADEIRVVLPSVEMLEQLHQKNAAEAHTDTLLAGIKRLGDYRILCELGRGGMGVVFKAEQESLGRHVALKVLHHGTAMSDMQRQRFEREAQAAAALHHTNIVPVFDVGEYKGHHYYVMQFISGTGLDEWIRDRTISDETGQQDPRSDWAMAARHASAASPTTGDSESSKIVAAGRRTSADVTSRFHDGRGLSQAGGDDALSHEEVGANSHPSQLPDDAAGARWSRRGAWTEVAEMGRQIAEALDYAHQQGTLHRDIKPANLIRDVHGKVWITDFGLAKLAAEDDLTQTGDVVGTLRYMAPEQFQGHADERTDVYALGLVLYELLTLRPAYDEDDRGRLFQQVLRQNPPRPRQISTDIPHDLETIVLKSMAGEAQHRYQTAEQMASDLALCLEDRPIQAQRSRWIERLWRWCRRNPALASASSAAVGLLIVVAVVMTLGYFRAVADRRMTQSQQRRAESNLQLALEAFERLFDRISANSTPSMAGQIEDEDGSRPLLLDVVSAEQAALLQELLDFYDRFAALNRSNPELQSTIAEANWRVGDIERRLQHLEQAEKAYRRSLSIYEALAHSNSATPFAVERSTILNQIGLICQSTRRMSVARQTHVAALELLEGLDKSDRKAERVRFEMARTLNFVGECDLWWSREFSTARQSLESACELIEGLLGDGSDKADYKYTQSQIYRNQWTLLTRESWFRRERRREMKPGSQFAAEVATLKNKALTILEELVSLYPTVPEYRYELCTLLSMTPPLEALSLEQIQTRWIPVLERASQMVSELCVEHAGIVPYAMLHVRIQRRWVDCVRRAGSRDDADRSFEQAAMTIGEYAQQYADQPAFVRQMAEANLAWGDFLMATVRPQRARDKLESAARQIEDYFERTNDRFVARLMLHIYDRLVFILEHLREHDVAATVREKAASIEGELSRQPGPPPPGRGPGGPALRRPGRPSGRRR